MTVPRAIAAACTMLVLAGCTATPDWADPTRWGEDEPAQPTQVDPDSAARSGADAFPNLASVPDTPPSVSSPGERARLREGLAADRTNAQYSGEQLVGDTRDQAPAVPRPTEAETAAAAAAPRPPQVAADIPSSPPPEPPAAPEVAAAPEQPPLPPPPSVGADAEDARAERTDVPAAPATRVQSVPRRISPRIVERVPLEEDAAAAPPSPPPAAMPAAPPPAAPASTQRAEPTVSAEPPPSAPRAQPAAADPAPAVTEAQRSETQLTAAQSAAVQRALAARAARLSGRNVGAEDTGAAAAPPTPSRIFASPPTAAEVSSPASDTPLAALTPPPTPAVPAGQSELVGVVYFGHGSASLDGSDRRVLRDVAALHRLRGGVIRLVGHASARTGDADPVAHRVANLEMSQKRAGAVAAALVGFGVSRANILAEARADSQPVYHEFMPAGEAGNRRVEIFLES